MDIENTQSTPQDQMSQKHGRFKKRVTDIFTKLLQRRDILAWIAGVCFISLMAAAVMLAGQAAHWDASSPYEHDNTTSKDRFTPEPLFCNETNVKGRHGERCYGRWYYWKLPVDKATSLTRAVVWLCYSFHQIILWTTIYMAQLEKEKSSSLSPKFGTKLTKYNAVLLAVNALFFFIHLGQTHWTYDGLAQDVGLASSEGAVVMILALILVLEYKNRGVAFMCPNDRWNKRLKVNMSPMTLVRKYHGYLICWAITYTFWYHPMESTIGHVLGFIHGGMLLLQGSLIYTRVHLNRYWRLLNETWVIVHGSFIAYQTHNPETYRQHWTMYFLGFGFMLTITQIYGLPFWRKIHFAFRAIPPVLFLVMAVILCMFNVIRGDTLTQSNYSKLKEMFYIPLELYGLMFLMWFLLFLWMKVEYALKSGKEQDYLVNTEITSDSSHVSAKKESLENSVGDRASDSIKEGKGYARQALGIVGFLLVHTLMITISFFLQWIDLSMPNTNIMFIIVVVFTFCWSIAIMMLKLATGYQVNRRSNSGD